MSRSYRRHFFYKCIFKGNKKRASKRVRQHKGKIPKGCFYKKLFNSWDVIDNIYYEPNTLKKIEEFKSLCDELESNVVDKHLTLEQVEEIVKDLKYYQWYFKVRYK